jgi:hypothetical protein
MWFFDTFLFDPRSTTLKPILLTFTPLMWFFDSFLYDPRSTKLDPANLYTTSNRKVSKNHIGGVKVSRIALSVVDRGSNRRVSKNHIGGVKVRFTTLDPANLYTTYVILYTFLFDPRSTTLKAFLLTFRKVSKNHMVGVKVSRIECGRSWVKQKSIKESYRWCKGLILWYFSVSPTIFHNQSC